MSIMQDGGHDEPDFNRRVWIALPIDRIASTISGSVMVLGLLAFVAIVTGHHAWGDVWSFFTR